MIDLQGSIAALLEPVKLTGEGGGYVVKELPKFRGYTVDERLREFRKINFGEEPEFIPFDSPKGQELLSEMRANNQGANYAYLKELARVLAEEAITAYADEYSPDEISMDGDQRKYLSREFLKWLNQYSNEQ